MIKSFQYFFSIDCTNTNLNLYTELDTNIKFKYEEVQIYKIILLNLFFNPIIFNVEKIIDSLFITKFQDLLLICWLKYYIWYYKRWIFWIYLHETDLKLIKYHLSLKVLIKTYCSITYFFKYLQFYIFVECSSTYTTNPSIFFLTQMNIILRI